MKSQLTLKKTLVFLLCMIVVLGFFFISPTLTVSADSDAGEQPTTEVTSVATTPAETEIQTATPTPTPVVTSTPDPTQQTSDPSSISETPAAPSDEIIPEPTSTTEDTSSDLPDTLSAAEDQTDLTDTPPQAAEDDLTLDPIDNSTDPSDLTGDSADGLAAQEATGLDPWFYVGSVQHVFVASAADCTTSANVVCHVSTTNTPFQDAIDYLKTNSVDPSDGTGTTLTGEVYVAAGTVTENLTLDGFANTLLNSPLTFIGGCGSYTAGVCVAGNNFTTLQGSLTVSNSARTISFLNFLFSGGINVANDTNVVFTGNGSDNQTITVNVSGSSGVDVQVKPGGGSGNKVVINAAHAYDNGSFTADSDISGSYTMDGAASDKISLSLDGFDTIDSHVDTKNFTYDLDDWFDSVTLKDADSAATGRMRLNNNAGDFIFNNPSDSLTVKLTNRDADLTVESFDNPYSGDLSLLGTSNYNDIDIKTDLLLLGGDLSIEGWDIVLEAGKILSTREIDVSAGIPDYQNATSIGPSGDVDIRAVSFTMKDGSKILAQGSASYAGGAVKIDAADTMGYAIDAIDWIREHLDILIGTQQGVYLNYAEVILNNANIQGDSVSINVDSGYVMDYYILQEVLEGTEVGSIVEALTSIAAIQKGLLPIPIGVNVRISSSKIELNGTSSILAANDVTLIASSEVKANLTTAFSKFAIAIAVGYGYANVSINDTARITSTAGNILIRSIDDNDAEVGAEVGSTKSTDVIKGKLLALALGASVVNSKITLASGAALSAYGSVNLLAEGKNFGGSRGTAYITGGGDGSITIGLFIGVSNVSTDVKGTITAQAKTNVASDLPIDLDKISNSVINIPNHGLKTGDVVTYHVGDYSTAIDGLTNGEQYYVIVLDADHIELVGKAPIDIDNGNVNDGSQQSLTPMEVKNFVPSGSLNADTDTFTISGHGFTAGEVIIYSSLQNDVIGGLSDMTQYTVFNVVGDTFQLKDSDGNLVDITSVPSGSDNQAFVYPDSANAKIIAVSDDNVINSNDDTIYIPNHGFETGDLILYTVDPTKTTNISVNYKYGVGLDAINTTDNTLCIQYAGDLAVGDEVVYNTTDHSSIDGLADGTTYIISALTACTEEDATCAYIQLTNKTTGQVVTFSNVTYDPVSQNGTAYTPVETLTKTETQVGMDAALAGLTNNTYYYVVKVDNDHIMLAASLDDAEQTGPIDLGVSATTHGSDHILETGLTNGIGISAILRTSEKSFAGAAVAIRIRLPTCCRII
jgi:hypothetical protein